MNSGLSHRVIEALEYLFLAVVTRADTDYLFRAVNRADEALRAAMPGWTPPVLMTTWHKDQPVAWMRDDGEDGSISTMTVCISQKVKDLWLKANPKQVERYTIPLYL